MKGLNTVCFAVLILSSGLSAQKAKTLAVLDFQTTGGISQSEASTLANRFRGILVNTKKFDVIERDKMNDLLKQQNFNVSDNCNSAECAVQIGQLLGVEQMIAGDIGKLGSTWTIDLRLLEVETGRIASTKSQDFKGEIDGMLEVMKFIANEFAGIETVAAPVVNNSAGFGDIYIVSTPTAAEIMLDGKKTTWTTPRLLENIPAGKHTIELSSGNLVAKQEIEIKQGGLENLSLTLTAPSIPVKFVSDPLQSVIYIDDVQKGTTPVILQVTVGDHKIRMVKDKFGDYNQSLLIKITDKSLTVNGVLPKITTLNLFALAPNIVAAGEVKVYLDDQLLGPPPIKKQVGEGKHIIRVVAASKYLKEFNKAINVSGETQVEAFLELTEAYLSLKPETKDKIKKGEIFFTPIVAGGQAQPESTTKVAYSKAVPKNSVGTIVALIIVVGAMAAGGLYFLKQAGN